MAELYKSADEASREVRSTGQTGQLGTEDQARMEPSRTAITPPDAAVPATPAAPPERYVSPILSAYEKAPLGAPVANQTAEEPYESTILKNYRASYEYDRAEAAKNAPAPVAGNKDGNFGTDLVALTALGVDNLAANARELIGRVPGIGKSIVNGLDAIDRWTTGKGSDQLIRESTQKSKEALTPEMTSAQNKQWWDSEAGSFGSAWTDPRSYISGIVQSLPEQAISMGPALRLAKGVYSAKIAAGASKEIAAAAAARAATIAGGISEGALAGAGSAREVRDQVMALDPKILEQSQAFQTLIGQGMDPVEAKSALAEDLATQAFITSGVITGAFGGFGDRVLAKAITTGLGKNMITRGFKGAIGEGVLEEFPQEYGSKVAQNLALQQADSRVGAFDDALNSGLGGLATGGIQGGAMTAIGGKNAGEPKTQEVTDTDGNVTVKYNTEVNQNNQDQARQFKMTDDEFNSRIQNPAYMAAEYLMSDDGTRALLRQANPDMDFNSMIKDQELVNQGLEMRTNDPAWNSFFTRLEETGQGKPGTSSPADISDPNKDAPFDPSDTADNPAPRFTPSRANMDIAGDLASQGIDEAEGVFTRNKPGADQSNQQLTSGPEQTESATNPEMDVLREGYSREVRNIEAMTDPARQRYTADQAITSMIRSGFTFDEANQMFGQFITPIEATDVADTGATEQQAPVETVSERLQTFNKVRKNLVKQDNGKWKVDSTEADYAPANLSPDIYKIASMFGVKVVGFKYTGKDPKMARRAGLSTPDGIALNASVRDQFLTVFGHEVYHNLSKRDKALAKELEARVLEYISEEGREAMRTKLANIGYDASKMDEETVADVMGIMFQDAQFWEKLSQEKPSLVQRVMRVIDDLIRRFGQLNNRSELVALHIQEMETVRDMMADFVTQALDKQQAQTTAIDESIEIGDDPVGQFKAIAATGNKSAAAKFFKEAKLFPVMGNFNVAYDEANKPAPAPVEKVAPVQKAAAPVETLPGDMPPLREADNQDTSPPRKPGKFENGTAIDAGTYSPPLKAEATDLGTAAKETDAQRKERVKSKAAAARKTYSDGVARAIINQDLDSKGDGVVTPKVEYEFLKGKDAEGNPIVVGKVLSANGKYYRFNIKPDGSFNYGTADNVGAVIAKLPEGATLRRVREGADPVQTSMDLYGNKEQANKFKAEVQRIMTQAFTPSRVAQDLAELRQSLQDKFQTPFFKNGKDRSDAEYIFKMFADVGAISSDDVVQKNEEIDAIKAAIEKLQNQDVRARAGMVKVNAAKIDDALDNLRRDMAEAGMSQQQINEIVGPAQDSLAALQDNNDAQSVLEETGNDQPTRDEKTQNLPGRQFSDARQAAAAAVDEIVNSNTSPITIIRRELNKPDREFTFSDLRKEMAARGMDISEIDREVAQWPAAQYSLEYWVNKKAGVMNPYAARTAWFNSYKNIMAIYKGEPAMQAQYEKELSDVERRFIRSMEAQREAVRNRRDEVVDEFGVGKQTPEEAFPHALFNKYSLNDMRNLEEANIPEDDAAVLRSLVGGNTTFLPRLWLDDVAYAMDARKDLRDQILAGMSDREAQAVTRYLQMSAAALANNERISALRSYSTMLDNIEGLDREAYEAFKQQIIYADLKAIPAVLQRAQEIADITSQAKDKKQLGEMLSAFLDKVYHEDEMQSRTLDETKDEFDKIAGRGTPEVTDADVDGYLEEMNRLGAQEGQLDRTSARNNLMYQKIAQAIVDEQQGNIQVNENETPASTNDQPENQVGLSGDIQYKRGRFSSGPAAATVQAHIAEITQNWKNKPNVQVFYNVEQIADPELRARLTERAEAGAFKGAIDPNTGAVYIFSQHVEDVADAEFVMFHELYGHWGLRRFLGDKLNAFLENQYRLNKQIKAEADRQFNDAIEDGSPMSRLESVEEAISDMATKGEGSLFRQLIGQLVSWLRKHNMNTVANWMDSSGTAELAHVLAAARRVARTGEGVSPMNGAPQKVLYARNNKPVELFSTRDDKLTGYARMNPVNQYWTVFTIKDPATGDFGAITVEDLGEATAVLKKVGTISKSKDRDTRQQIDPNNLEQIPDYNNLSGWKKFTRNAQIHLQNVYLPIFEVARFLDSKGVKNSVIQDLIMYESRLGYFVNDFEKRIANPVQRLLADAGKKGATVEDIDEYLMARHAEERNDAINTINPDNRQGSGMSTKEAGEALKRLEASAFSTELKEIGKLMDQLSRDKLNALLNSGLINKYQYAALSKYEHYVNLSGNKALGLDAYDSKSLGGKAFNLKGADVIRSTGRGTKAVDVLQNTMNSYLSAIIRAQKNRPVTAILKMMEQNPDPTYVTIEPIKEKKTVNVERLNFDKQILRVIGDAPTEFSGREYLKELKSRVESGEIDTDDALSELASRINEAEQRRDGITPADATKAIRQLSEAVVTSARLSPDGYVSMVEDNSLMLDPSVLVAKVDGRPVVMRFTERGGEFIQSITGMNIQQGGAFTEAMGKWNRLFSQLVTSWNPAWLPINFIRDIQTAFANASSDPRVGVKLANEMRKEWMPALKAAWRYTRIEQAEMKGEESKAMLSDEWRDLIQDFYKDGGGTFFLDRKGLEQTLDKINRHINGPHGVRENIESKLEVIGDFMDLLATPSELAPRLAAYKVLLKNGWSREDAAQYAKELTVNFNMKGEGKSFRSMYVFANPAIQGTFRLFQDYSRGDNGIQRFMPSNRFAAVAGTWMMLGMLANYIARAIGGDDDERPGVDQLDTIPGFKRSTSLIFMPNMVGGSIPVAYGWNLFSTAGTYMFDVMTGRTKPEVAATKVLATAFDSLSPLGSGAESKTLTGMGLKTFLPSPLVPLAELGLNENRFGAPIYKESNAFSDIKEGNAYMHFNSVNPLSKAAMQALAQATSDGNARYKPGLIDVNPAAVDYLISSYLPGLFNEAYRSAGWAANKMAGRDVKDLPVPVVDRFKAKTPEGFDNGAVKRVSAAVDTVFSEFSSRATSPERRQQIVNEHPSLGAAKAVVSGVNQDLRKISSQLKAAEEDPRISDADKVRFRNQMEEQKKYHARRLVQAAVASGFKDEVIDNKSDTFIGKVGERLRK
jgi:hypothetical protein